MYFKAFNEQHQPIAQNCNMRVLIQRVSRAKVTTPEGHENSIGRGLLIFAGIEHADNQDDVQWLAGKIVSLRIFDDELGIMNRSVTEVHGEIMVVSQFTLHARTKKGNRPSYMDAATPDVSVPLYEFFMERLETLTGKQIARGVFGAKMQVELTNDGPVTIWIDSKQRV